MASVSNSEGVGHDLWSRNRRSLVRLCFFALVGMMVMDVLPWRLIPGDTPKSWNRALTTGIGVWQGQWKMFAPTPSVHKRWFTAEITHPGVAGQSWSSPYWGETGGWQKFYLFRHMNYFERLHSLRNRGAAEDFAYYLARTRRPHGESAMGEGDGTRVVLVSNGLKLVMPQDGRLPSKEEITWITFSDVVADVEQGP